MLTMQTVLFRADGGGIYSMAMGHLFRSVRLAGVLSKRGVRCLFIMRNYPEGVKFVTNAGFAVDLLDPAISEEEEVSYVVSHAIQLDALLYIDIRFSIKRLIEEASKEYIPTVVYEDVCGEDILPTVLINPTLTAQNEKGYEDREDMQLLIGTDYLVLDPFIEDYARSSFSPEINKLFLCFGGADPCNISNRILKILLAKKDEYQITLILGPSFKYHSDIKKTVRYMGFDKRVTVISNCDDLYSILSTTDAAITAGGNIVYESISLNIPTFVLPSIDYEAVNMTPLIDAGLISGIKEDIANVKDVILEEEIDCFINEPDSRKRLFDKACLEHLSGGIFRVVEVICKTQRLYRRRIQTKHI